VLCRRIEEIPDFRGSATAVVAFGFWHSWELPAGEIAVALGNSPRERKYGHAVVYCGNALVHDPFPNGRGLPCGPVDGFLRLP